MPQTVQDKYKKYTDREHVLERPDMYIGSVEKEIENRWVLADGKMVRRDVTVVKGLYKVFDEACVNARDHFVRMSSAAGSTKSDDQPVKLIEVTIDRETGIITVRNDGNGIDVAVHPEHGVYVPEMIFGHLRTSTNYDDGEAKTTGGRNGYGVKLAFVWALWGEVETVDHKRKLKYSQRFESNLSSIKKASIGKSSVKPYTSVSFLPDYARFGLPGLTDDMYAVLEKRVYDLGAVTPDSVRIKLNGTVLPTRTFAACADLYLGPKADAPRFVETSGSDRWRYAVARTTTDEFEQLSFVNGIHTAGGGSHVTIILNQITRKLVAYIQTKKGVKVKPTSIKEQLWLMLDCVVENPSFDSQTKDVLKTPASKFGSTPTVSDKMIEKIAKMGVMETALSLTAVKDTEAAKKTDGKKSRSVRGIVKLTDANFAGGPKSGQCTLILCEGDSAQAGVLSGLSKQDRNTYGVYALKGKPLNVRDVTPKRVADNNECTEIKQAMGLTIGTTYADAADVTKRLRYGSIMIMADQDLDGSHIKGLVVNFIETQWPSLAAIPGFLKYMSTPIVKARKGQREVPFYSEAQKAAWEATQGQAANSWKLKYYKGLGTSSGKEWREYFADPHVTQFDMTAECPATLRMAFAKSESDARKVWLEGFDPTASFDPREASISYTKWTHTHLRPFSVYDCERSVSGVDGLKPSQRKVLYAARKRNLTQEIKVAQLAGYVSEHAAYHHGEASLNKTITGMAQEFVGSNNIALLSPEGQFGTRLQGGKDSASERYIYTKLNAVTNALFPPGDDAVLPKVVDDGQTVEPEYYAPVMPLSVVNGVCGIGTGFSSNVPSYNPAGIVDSIRSLLRGETIEDLTPHFAGFTGEITVDGHRYSTHGMWAKRGANTIHVTELPVGFWTQDFKARLEKLIAEKTPAVKGYTDMSTDQSVDFVVEFAPSVLPSAAVALASYVDKTLGLSRTGSTSNMHLFDEAKKITKFASAADIVRAYVPFRLAHCENRIAWEIAEFLKEIITLENKCRFIREQLDGELDLRRKKTDAANALLKTRGYAESADGNYNYLLRMPFTSLLEENIEKMEGERTSKLAAKAALEATTPARFWLSELDTFEKAYAQYCKDRSRRHAK